MITVTEENVDELSRGLSPGCLIISVHSDLDVPVIIFYLVTSVMYDEIDLVRCSTSSAGLEGFITMSPRDVLIKGDMIVSATSFLG